MLCIGLTGPTGSGKTMAALWLAERGAAVIDCDLLARRVTAPGSPTLAKLAEVFGKEILAEDGTLDRALLAKRAFSDTEATKRLNAVTHPAILALVAAQLDELRAADTAVAVIDAPLLYESGLDRICDGVLAVLADREVRLRRICERDGIDREAGLRRMAAQPDDDFYLSRGAVAVRNDGDLTALSDLLRTATARWMP